MLGDPIPPGPRRGGRGGRTTGDAPTCGLRPEPRRLCPRPAWLSLAPQKASEGQDPALSGRRQAEDWGDGHHVNARHLLYPNAPVTRFPVPNEKVPWEVSAGVPASRLGGRWGGAAPCSLTGTGGRMGQPGCQGHTAEWGLGLEPGALGGPRPSRRASGHPGHPGCPRGVVTAPPASESLGAGGREREGEGRG